MKSTVYLVRNGVSSYRIVFASAAGAPTRFAAEELRRYVRGVADAELPAGEADLTALPARTLGLIALDGESEWTPPETRSLARRLENARPGSYVMGAPDGRIWILGRDGGGLVSGVYDFIETFLGVRFFEPGPKGEYAPKQTTVTIPLAELDRFEEPAFVYRGLPDASSMSGPDLDTIDWMAKNRLNYYQLMPSHWDQCHETILPELTKRGMKLAIMGHCSGHFFPMGTPEAEAMLKDHPERYAAIDGRRVARQMCYSNPDTVRIFTDNVAAWVRRYPEIASLAVFSNDGPMFCQCEQCGKIGPGKLLYETNRTIAEKILPTNPDTLVMHLSYSGGTHAPFEGIRPIENLADLYCPYISESKFHPIYDYRYGCRRLLNETQGNHRAICRDIRDWRRLNKVLVGSYFSDQIMRGRNYMPYPDIIRDDLRYYRAAGVYGFVDILCYLEIWWMDTLNLRVFARLLWNTEEPLETILSDFYRTYYGDAGEAVAAFDRWVGDFMRLTTYHGFVVGDYFPVLTFGDNVKVLAKDFRPELDATARHQTKTWFARGARHLADAGRLVENGPDLFRRRVRRLAICFDKLIWGNETTYDNIAVAYWADRTANAASDAERADAKRQLATAVEEAKTAWARLDDTLQPWRTTSSDEPGAKLLAESFDTRDLLAKYAEALGDKP